MPLEPKARIFLVVGRMGKSLVRSKAEPFAVNPAVGRIWIFRETEGFPVEKAEYVSLPAWILKLRPKALSKFIRLFAEPLQLIFWAVKHRPDIINGYHIIPKGLNSLAASWFSGSKCIISLIGGIVEVETYSRFKKLMKRINIFALRRTDLITTKGTVVNTYLYEHGLPVQKIIIFNGSVDLKNFSPPAESLRKTDLLFIGTFRNLKGPDKMIRMVHILKDRFPEIKASLLGDGYLMEECRRLSAKLNLTENIRFHGHIDNPAPFFRDSKVLLMPSRSEGMPTSMLEAMACGCVPVVSNVGNIRDIVIPYQNAFLVDDYTDIDEFARLAGLLLADETLRSSMALNGISLVNNSYSPAAQSAIVEQMLRRLTPEYVIR